MDECTDSLGDAKVFMTLDPKSGYWQLPVRDKDRENAAFTSYAGLIREPFDLMNALATLQRALDVILAQCK